MIVEISGGESGIAEYLKGGRKKIEISQEKKQIKE